MIRRILRAILEPPAPNLHPPLPPCTDLVPNNAHHTRSRADIIAELAIICPLRNGVYSDIAACYAATVDYDLEQLGAEQ